jgi:hypothetical protein
VHVRDLFVRDVVPMEPGLATTREIGQDDTSVLLWMQVGGCGRFGIGLVGSALHRAARMILDIFVVMLVDA